MVQVGWLIDQLYSNAGQAVLCWHRLQCDWISLPGEKPLHFLTVIWQSSVTVRKYVLQQ